jgi:hypothetical protein
MSFLIPFPHIPPLEVWGRGGGTGPYDGAALGIQSLSGDSIHIVTARLAVNLPSGAKGNNGRLNTGSRSEPNDACLGMCFRLRASPYYLD